MLIRELAEDQRPRERLAEHGAEKLSDGELLALLLQNGSQGEDVVSMANRLIATHGLEGLASISAEELVLIKGVGPAKASKIVACVELCRRMKASRLRERTISGPEDVVGYFMEKYGDSAQEHFIAVFLDTKHRILGVKVISVGTLNASIVHPREVFREAVRRSAHAVILVHNHPSGDPTPSPEDRKVTSQMVDSGKIMGIEVLDHVVVGHEGWRSCLES